MAPNIDAETEALVRRLASERGLSTTAAIRLAVTNELAQDEPVGSIGSNAIDVIQRQTAERLIPDDRRNSGLT